jgi:hypothetical protein
MDETVNLEQEIERRGPYAVWDLMDEEERRAAAVALWANADRDTRSAIDLALAKELKFRPQSVRHLPAERVVPRLLRLADSLPDAVLFQFLFHLHLVDRKPLLVEFLDAVGLPHTDGVLDLGEEAPKPDPTRLLPAARDLLAKHGRQALVYLATLRVADKEFWVGLEEVLAGYGADGAALTAAS